MTYRYSVQKIGTYAEYGSGTTPILEIVHENGSDVRRPRPTGIALLAQPTSHSAKTVRHKRGDWAGWPTWPSDHQAGFFTGDFSEQSAAKRRANLNLLGKMKDEKINLAVACGEYRETGAMFVDIAKRVIDTYRYARKGRILQAYNSLLGYEPRNYHHFTRGEKRAVRLSRQYMNAARLTGDHWLAYRYGITPMVADLNAGIRLIYESDFVKSNGDTAVYRVAGKGFGRYQDGFTHDPTIGWGEDRTYSSNINVKTVAYYKIVPLLAQLKSFGLTNMISAGYELIPGSFVLDWFIPIGEHLAVLDALVGCSVIGSTESMNVTKMSTCQYWRGSAGADGKGIYWENQYVRTANPDITNIGLPEWSPSMTAKRIGDTLAAAFTVFGRKPGLSSSPVWRKLRV